MNKALIIVDMQNDFISGALAVPRASEIVGPIQDYAFEKYSKENYTILLTRDLHPKYHCSFVAHGGHWPPHCVVGTIGAVDRLYAVREYVPDRANPTNYGIKTASYGHFLRTTTVYEAGQWYSMKYDEFHSIEFSKGARVLFIEGPKIKDTSYFLEPVVNGKVVPLFDVPTWMYKP